MMYDDGNCPLAYAWLSDEADLGKWTAGNHIGHLIVDELKLWSKVYWSFESHKVIGFVSDEKTLDLGNELKQLMGKPKMKKLGDELEAKASSYVNQWRFRSIHGKVHNGEYYFNS